jgi:hypothetical protein
MSYSYGSDGIVHGITNGRIATVEVVSPAGSVTVSTQPLPKEFDGHRHFVAFLTESIKPTELIARRADGSVFSRRGAFGR